MTRTEISPLRDWLDHASPKEQERFDTALAQCGAVVNDDPCPRCGCVTIEYPGHYRVCLSFTCTWWQIEGRAFWPPDPRYDYPMGMP